MGFLLVAAFAPVPAHGEVTLQIFNMSGQPVCVMWTGTASLTGTTSSGTPIANSDYNVNAAGYPLSAFTEVTSHLYQIGNFTMNGGRMWFTFGDDCWAFQNAGYTPALANFTDLNFNLRYDKIEASITGSVDDNLDITAVDAFSIPFAVAAWNSANPATTTQSLRGSLGNGLINALGAVAANANAAAPVTPAGGFPPLPQISGYSPYLMINANSQGASAPAPYTGSPIGSTGSFVRVIANDNTITPNAGDPVAAVNNGGAPANYSWTTYDNYVKRMDGRAAVTYTGPTKIVGQFAGLAAITGASTSPQNYNVTATFDATESRTVTYTHPSLGPFGIAFTGWVTLKGTTTIASGTYAGAYTVEIKIPYGGLSEYMTVQAGFPNPNAFLLSPSGVVGANANYLYKYYVTVSGDPGVYSQTNPYFVGPPNDVRTWLMGDLLAGMNVGAAGSDKTFASPLTINGNLYPAGTKVGAFNSQDWWSLGSTLRTGNESVYHYYFGYLQSDTDLYNQYAETVYPFTDAYGFAYSDRITDGRAAISWDATLAGAIDTVRITILPDARVGPRSGGAVEAIEYHHKALDHYFVTRDHDEIARLDVGTVIKGWRRTGRSFKVYPTGQAGTSAVCRFYIPPALGNSHFYGRNAAECNATAAKYPGFIVEDPAFMHVFLPAAGVCPVDTSPMYRLFNNRAGTNHRYVADPATRDQMVARGWVAEGDGPDRVVMCTPD